ncbi:MAG: 5-(carboxyamino)imidazole ribonucleotide mutase [Calditrichaeota bacterium]|nr:MAG: 5-(carboxyamino)imidazole ribonucleotide mutase [Calditrichota bacterium]
MSKVAILIGSKSDKDNIKNCQKYLDYFGIENELLILSAHRNPAQVAEFSTKARGEGYVAIVAAAGMAAHLAGVVAAHTTLPVIGVPMPGSALQGVDALYSTVQMPTGVPVATMAIGSAGAANAAIFIAEMLSLGSEKLEKKLTEFRKNGARL